MADIQDKPASAELRYSETEPGALPPRRRRHKSLVILAAGSLLIGGAVFFVATQRPDPLAELATETVSRGDIADVVMALGKIRPNNDVDVGAQVSGQLTRLLVHSGQAVQSGDELAQIDPQLPAAKVEADRAQLAGLRADLADIQAQSDFAAGELRRQLLLKQQNSTRDDLVDQARRDSRSSLAKVDAVRARIDEAQSTLKADETQLGYTRIYAPMSGVVVSVTARQGQTINATYSTPVLMRIANLATMTVWTEVSEADIVRLRVGMPLYFTTLGFGDRRWEAKLRDILPAPIKPGESGQANTGEQTTPSRAEASNVVLYTALFDIANPLGELRPEMTAQVSFITASAKNALRVAASAVSSKGPAGPHTVQIVAGDRLETRTVTVGVRTRFTAEILSGLQEGDTVVTGHKADRPGRSLLGFRL